MPHARHTTERDEIKMNLNFLELNIAILKINAKSKTNIRIRTHLSRYINVNRSTEAPFA